jgi:hypothetical protein
MTQPAASLIDEIVREVLARLNGGSAVPPDNGTSGVSPGNPPQKERNDTPEARRPKPPATGAAGAGELAISSRVVSLAGVEDRLKGIRRLVVPPGAVVTPSVRDELRRKNIALVHGRPAAASADAACRVFLLVLGPRFEPGPLQNALAADGLVAEDICVERLNCLIAATDRAARELGASNTVVLLVSGHPAAALCLANRHAGVRAVLGIDPGRLAGDAASVGANLLVLDPRTTGPFPLNQMAVQFCRQGPLDCPAELGERLDAGEKEST